MNLEISSVSNFGKSFILTPRIGIKRLETYHSAFPFDRNGKCELYGDAAAGSGGYPEQPRPDETGDGLSSHTVTHVKPRNTQEPHSGKPTNETGKTYKHHSFLICL